MAFFVGLFRKLGIFAKYNPKVGQNVYKFNRIFRKIRIFGEKYPIITMSSYILWRLTRKIGNSEQNVQYFSQMATLLVVFPEYSGYSNQIVTSPWDFSENSGNSYRNTYICQCKSQKLLALATINAYNAYNVYNAYKML